MKASLGGFSIVAALLALYGSVIVAVEVNPILFVGGLLLKGREK